MVIVVIILNKDFCMEVMFGNGRDCLWCNSEDFVGFCYKMEKGVVFMVDDKFENFVFFWMKDGVCIEGVVGFSFEILYLSMWKDDFYCYVFGGLSSGIRCCKFNMDYG